MDVDEVLDEELTVARRRDLRRSLPAELRNLYASVLADTLANGLGVSASALVVVLHAHAAGVEDPLAFTSEQIERLLWFAIDDFCEDEAILAPSGCHEALHAAIATASASELLSSRSDRPRDLFNALDGLRAS